MNHRRRVAPFLLIFGLALLGEYRPSPVDPRGRATGAAWAAPAAGGTVAKQEGELTNAHNAYLPTPDEVKMGREGATEAEKEYKILKEGEQVRRLQAIADEVVRAALDPQLLQLYLAEKKLPKPKDSARRVPFSFSFKLADSKEVNAFSFAGGPIYVTTGLMEYIRSDHELAAVLAHEVAHVTHHHLVQLIQHSAKAQKQMMWALLAAVLSGAASSPEFGSVMMGAQLYMIAKQFGYGREAERDADKTGVAYLRRTRFNPIGMLTVMKRFARDEARRGRELGIYQSHPYARERAELVTGYLKDAGIHVDRGTERDVSNSFQVETRSATMAGQPVAELLLNGALMFRAVAGEGKSAMERAGEIERRLEVLLDQNLAIRNLRLSNDKSQVLARDTPLLTVSPGDAAVNGLSRADTAQRALDVVLKALWNEQLDQTF